MGGVDAELLTEPAHRLVIGPAQAVDQVHGIDGGKHRGTPGISSRVERHLTPHRERLRSQVVGGSPGVVRHSDDAWRARVDRHQK